MAVAGLELWGWGEKDSVKGNKQTTLHLGQYKYKSQDLRLSLGFYSHTVSHVELATGILLRTTACCIATRTQVRLTYNTRSHVAC